MWCRSRAKIVDPGTMSASKRMTSYPDPLGYSGTPLLLLLQTRGCRPWLLSDALWGLEPGCGFGVLGGQNAFQEWSSRDFILSACG